LDVNKSPAPPWDTVAILGVGLIGGSIGLALRSRGQARHVIGIGRRESRLRVAQQVGAVDDFYTDLAQGVARAELSIVCTPVSHIVAQVRQISRVCPAGALITDAGSTKAGICRDLDRLEGNGTFVGSHPMAGSEKSGVEFARDNLFQDRVTVVTPTDSTDSGAVQRTEAFWAAMGSRIVRTTPEDHDRMVAEVSHLPHLVASALAAATRPENLIFAAKGWRDTTRVAAGDAELWRQIFSENRGHVLQSIDDFGKVLAAFRDAIAEDDRDELLRLLQSGKQCRESVGS
jgi:prephenate dehydrogenase